MMMHDQSKLFSNEFYHGEARYGIDDGMIDDFMISGSESLGDLPHLETNINKASNMSTLSAMPLSTEDYFNQYTFNQVTNIMMNNTSNQNPNLANSNQYTYHTLQSPQIQEQNPAYNNQLIQSNGNMNSYMHLGSNGASGAGNGQTGGGPNQYASKIIHRTPSYNSSMCASSSSTSSSPSSLLSSSNSSLTLTQTSNNQICVHSSTNDSFDYDNASSTGTPAVAADPAEIARQKQMRGLTLTPEEHQLLAKDRQRKDNHNMIERRRRFNINDRIKELGQLLPKNGEYDAKQNKGSILKASVDYIFRIKAENEEYKKVLDTNKYLVQLNKKLYNKVKEFEMICRSNGIPFQQPLSNDASSNSLKEANHENHSTTFASTFNTNELSHKLEDNQTVQQQQQHHTDSTSNVAPIDGCLPMMVFTENAPFPQVNSTNDDNLNQPLRSKSKAEGKKRNHSNLGDSDYNSSKIQKIKDTSKEIKLLKEEPISPKSLLLQQQQLKLLEPSPSLIDSYSNFHDQTDLLKYSTKVPFQNTRFIMQAKVANRTGDSSTSSSKVFIDSEQKDLPNLNSSSKDPTLASSSISSPSSPSSTSPSSSNSSSSNSSLCQN